MVTGSILLNYMVLVSMVMTRIVSSALMSGDRYIYPSHYDRASWSIIAGTTQRPYAQQVPHMAATHRAVPLNNTSAVLLLCQTGIILPIKIINTL